MQTILWILLGASAVIFILKLLFQMGRIRHGSNMNPGRLGVLFNWILIIVFVGSLGGLIYGFVNPEAYQSHSKPAQTVSSSSSSSSSSSATTDTEADRVTWTPKRAKLNDNGEAKVRFTIPAGYKVQIVGHKYGSKYKTFKRVNHERTAKFTFSDAGEYDIICIAKNGDKRTYHLRIHNASSESSSNSNSSSSSSNSSSSSSSKASSSSSHNNSNSNNNNSNNSGSNGGGSGSGSRSSNTGTSGGGGGSTSSYRAPQRSTGGGGGGSYTPSRPAQQAPSQTGGPVGPGY